MFHSAALTNTACAPVRSRQRFAVLHMLLALRRSRADLAGLTEAQLDDIGRSKNEANREAARAPWDVPSHWRS